MLISRAGEAEEGFAIAGKEGLAAKKSRMMGFFAGEFFEGLRFFKERPVSKGEIGHVVRIGGGKPAGKSSLLIFLEDRELLEVFLLPFGIGVDDVVAAFFDGRTEGKGDGDGLFGLEAAIEGAMVHHDVVFVILVVHDVLAAIEDEMGLFGLEGEVFAHNKVPPAAHLVEFVKGGRVIVDEPAGSGKKRQEKQEYLGFHAFYSKRMEAKRKGEGKEKGRLRAPIFHLA